MCITYEMHIARIEIVSFEIIIINFFFKKEEKAYQVISESKHRVNEREREREKNTGFK